MARTKPRSKRASGGKLGAQLVSAGPTLGSSGKAKRRVFKAVPLKRPAAGDADAGTAASAEGRSKQTPRASRAVADLAFVAAANREASPPVEQPPAKRRKLGTPGGRQLEVGRVLVCFDSNILMGHGEAAEAAWAAIQAGGGARVQALVPLKVRHELRSLAGSAGRRDGQPSPPARRATAAARHAELLLERMMRAVDCCRVQREDEQYRRHPRRVAEQRGDCAILDSLLHFQSLGAQVLLATADRGLSARASEHGVPCASPAQLVAAVQAALAAGRWTAEHDRELALLLFAPGYQQAALGASFPPHTEEAYAAFARRLQQPLQRVLLAATQLLAGSPAAAAAAASCWDGAGSRLAPGAVEQPASPAVEPAAEPAALPAGPVAPSAGRAGRAGRAVGPAWRAADPTELLRLLEEPAYREQVCGTRKRGLATVARRFGMSKQRVAEAFRAAQRARRAGSKKRKLALVANSTAAADPGEPAAGPAGPAGPAATPAELLRLLEDPAYREQVCGTRDFALATVASHFGMAPEAVAAAAKKRARKRRKGAPQGVPKGKAWLRSYKLKVKLKKAKLKKMAKQL